MIINANQISAKMPEAQTAKRAAALASYAKSVTSSSKNIWESPSGTGALGEKERSGVYTEEQARQGDAVREIPDDAGVSPSAFIKSCTTGGDLKDLTEEGTPLEEYTAAQVERAVSRVKRQRLDRREAVGREVARYQEREDSLERHLQKDGLVPATEENLSRLSQAVDMAEEISDFSQDSVKCFIRSEYAAVTPENICASNAAAGGGERRDEVAAASREPAARPHIVWDAEPKTASGNVRDSVSGGGAVPGYLYGGFFHGAPDGANAAGVMDGANAAGAADGANAAGAADGANATGAADGANAVGVTDAANTAGAADGANAVGVTDAANTAGAADALNSVGAAARTAAMRGPSRGGNARGGDVFGRMESQASSILSRGGVEVSEKTIGIARYLFENDLPVTAENVKIYQALEDLKNVSSDTILSRILDHMADGVAPERADLSLISRAEAAELVEEFVNTDVQELREAYPREAEFIRARRGLEEIRLMMTAEAARTMAAKGISLDISNIERIVEELRRQERQIIDSCLEENGLEVTDSNAELLGNTIQAAERILAAPAEMLGVTRPYIETQTFGEMADAADAAAREKLGQLYETVGTEVRPDLGDRISKAFQNVDDILVDLGLEATAANERAVRILAYNRMELTADSIIDMKAYDAQVTGLMERLTPSVAAELVKRQINPLELTMGALSDEVENIEADGAAVQDDISFSRYLWKMDRQGEFTPEERQSLIGIYRLLDKVKKSDGAVVGQIVKEGRELTLGSLLSASRSRRAAGIDVPVDDGFGGIEKIVEKGTSISDQILAAYGETVVSKLQKNLSPKVIKNQIPKVLRSLSADGKAGGEDISLERLLEECGADAGEESSEFYERMAAELRAVVEGADGRVEQFLEMTEQPATVENLAAARYYLQKGSGRRENLWEGEEGEEVVDALDEPDVLDEVFEKIDTAHKEKLEKKKDSDDITYSGLMSLVQMAGNISFYRNLRRRQMYDVPIVTENGITNCRITIQDGSGRNKGSVEITMETEKYGTMQASFRVDGQKVKGFVTAEKDEGVSLCGKILEEFEKDLEENGFTMEGGSPVRGSRNSLHSGNIAEGAKNRDLYRIAKSFIVCAKQFA